MLGAWDRHLAGRTAVLAGLTELGALVVIVATDDGATWPRRAAMLAAAAPVAGALGVVVALRRASGRGELCALEALGASPRRARRGAALGGAVIGLFGALLASTRLADLEALFPRPSVARQWVADGPSAMLELTSGLRVSAPGVLSQLAARPPTSPTLEGVRAMVVLCLALAAVATPTWAAAREGSRVPALRQALVATCATLAALVGFQAVATGRAPPALLLAAPLILLADLFALSREASR